MSGWWGVAIIDVSDGFNEKGTLQFAQHKLTLQSAISPDATRAYYCYIYAPGPPSQAYKGLIAVDFDLDTGALSLANDIQLTQVPADAGAIALSPDGRTLYVLTGADTLTTFDTTTFAPVPYSCGLDDQFMPMLIVPGTQAGRAVLHRGRQPGTQRHRVCHYLCLTHAIAAVPGWTAARIRPALILRSE